MLLTNKMAGLLVTAGVVAGCTVTPAPIPQDDRTRAAQTDQALIHASQEPIGTRMRLGEAMARALKYNLDKRVKLMEQALSQRNFDLVKMDMLPVLAASAGYLNRDNTNASTSVSIETGNVSLEPSTSQDRERKIADLKFAWNALDFGVSYLRAQQEADRYLIARNERQKVMLRLLQQTRATFWRAAVMQQMSDEIDSLLARAERSAASLRQVRREKLKMPLGTLQNLRGLLDIVSELEQMQQTVNAANVELAVLVNIPPGTHVTLDCPDTLPSLPIAPSDMSALELTALANSMDYSNQLYNARIDQRETRKELLRLWPGVEFAYTGNYDSNSYLYHQGWGEASIRVSWNIFGLLSHRDIESQGEARMQLTDARRMAVNMAVVAQVHLAWQHYRNTLNRYQRAGELNGIDQDIARLTRQAMSHQAASDIERIQSEARALRSAMNRLLAYAEAQDAWGAMLFSLNLDPVPEDYQQWSVADISHALDSTYAHWESGAIPTVQVIAQNMPAVGTVETNKKTPLFRKR
ncbi:MAG: hypothetical protein B0D91_12660 [Oceanospirillales bacterium LUC14_002_19_P2]|nr:MAG: hypothetical protein B0D91_12660 [Oceanospirillales bacterium LUC14_002_19_P2]